MEGQFVLLLRKSFRRYWCDAAIDAAGNAIVNASGDVDGVAASVRFSFMYEKKVSVYIGAGNWARQIFCGYIHGLRCRW